MGRFWLAILALYGPPQNEGWGPPEDGVATRLILVSKDHKIGDPIKLSCETKNFATEDRPYSPTSTFFLSAIGPDGTKCHDLHGPCQLIGQTGRRIAPGEIRIEFSEVDITKQYLFDKPGKHTINIGKSNKVVVDVLDTPIPDKLNFVRNLIGSLPQKWQVVSHNTDFVLTSNPEHLISDIRWHAISFTEKRIAPNEGAEYLDETTMGHVWITKSQPDIVQRWTEYKTVIQEQLKPFKK